MSGNQLYIYSAFFSIFCCFLTSLIGLIKINNLKQFKFLLFYPLISGIQISISVYFDFVNYNPVTINKINTSSINLFLLLEFAIIYRFYNLLFPSSIANRIIKFTTLIYSFAIILYWILEKSIFALELNLFITHSAIILTPAFFYIIQLLKMSNAIQLSNNPSFWVTIGIIFYFGCTTPLFLMKDFIFDKEGSIEEDGLYAINFICYSIMFMFISKGYLCKQAK